ncbi:AAA15 family ATPase/GTPase [Allocatelliglobosispora scoriae]|uniref:AAA15 family ATPase/GTPase n=2 Tax=Allocatelliglobosispora scoriae TaxID=643052 RepID=A0A841BV16_9ACTN|nr:AAA family ATPase [Allocatelliglobosispora scoriae]MBB5870592.1 AAA15 family ATPase/GTPase [Allocatelliglobosispora scoriae]
MHDDDKLVVKNLLSAADVGIVDVSLKPLPEEIMDSIQSDDMDAAQIRRIERNRAREQKLQFAHRSASGSVMMDIDDESTGTQQLLDLAVDVAFTLRYGTVMTVDEIDASLHPMLTARLIWLFQHAATNPRFGQLIFTSHDATLLGNFEGEEVLHRDQIWFAEKADDGSSVLYPLVEFKPRKDENRQRRYLNGSYGGVPELSEDVFEQALILRGDIDGEGQE